LAEGKKSSANAAADSKASLFLDQIDKWLGKYKPGMLRRKQVELFTRMANAKTL